MTNEMLQMYQEGILNNDQSYWYRETKTKEEFYVRSEDPFSLNNLISDPSYKKIIKEHRIALKSWQNEINDIGGESEKKHFYHMWPDGIQPKSNPPII